MIVPSTQKQAALYARYSTDNQTDNSIAYQMQAMQAYCAQNDIKIVATFQDEAESGTNTDRKDFNNMLAAARRGEFNTIIIYDIFRGSRDVADWFNFRKEMEMLGIEVVSLNNQLGDIRNPGDFLTELISIGMGHVEVLSARQKSIAGVAVQAKQGMFLGGRAPLGYKIVDRQYVIVEEEAKAVRTIFEMYADGRSYGDIIFVLDGMRGRNGRPLGKNSFNSILRNERYIGVYTWNKRIVKNMRRWAGGKPNPNCVRIEDAIPAIIDKETWERVQWRMDKNKKKCPNAKREYLLSGLIECESCGGTFLGRTTKNSKGYETTSYVCGNKYRTKTCKCKNIPASQIEPDVLIILKDYLSTLDLSNIAFEISNAVNASSNDLKAEKAEQAQLEFEIGNVMKSIRTGLDIPELRDELEKMRIRKSELDDIISRRSTKKTPVQPEKVINLIKWGIENIDTDPKRVIQNHITKIYAHADGSYDISIGVSIVGCGGWI
ncbi:recombinase family protein [Christensenellaceae bacterium OttesenSCG-928-K19]|nr:recombinase family protein [Christensenellaceae bacterium OttesenSCG-928-K19]